MSITLLDIQRVAIGVYIDLNKSNERSVVVPMATLTRKSLIALDDGYNEFIKAVTADNEMFHSWCHFQIGFATALDWRWSTEAQPMLRHLYYSAVGSVLGVEKITIDESLWSNSSFLVAVALRFFLHDMVAQEGPPAKEVRNE